MEVNVKKLRIFILICLFASKNCLAVKRKALELGNPNEVMPAEKYNKNYNLVEAIFIGDIDKANQLIDAGTNVNRGHKFQENTPLIYAAYFGESNLVNKLIQNGAIVDKANRDGTTALMTSASLGHLGDRWLEIALNLLDAGANPNAIDLNRHKASDYAAEGPVKGLLLEAEAEANL